MPVLDNIGLLARCLMTGPQSDAHILRDAAMAWRDSRIAWVGPSADLPSQFEGEERFDAGRRLVLPGLIDCHTHLAFGGWRADEFEQRIAGKTYLEIAGSGGGIARTVEATRRATEAELLARCEAFLGEMAALGITTVECKSGYGLDVETELKQLRIYQALARRQPVKLVPTFLAHVVPSEYTCRRAEYVKLICEELIPRIARDKLATSCDVFVEESAFDLTEGRAILSAARLNGLARRVHADQLTDTGAAQLAAEFDAVSADHLERTSEPGLAAMARANVVGVTLPIASLYLGTPPVRARRLIEAGVRVAVATDFNPGSAPSFHLPLAMLLACTLQKMLPRETVKAVTMYAAKATGCEVDRGSLEADKAADFVVIDAEDTEHWVYHFRPNACVATFIDGRLVSGGL